MSNYQNRSVFILGVLFFLLYLWLPLSTPLKFNSPDETANYFWAREFATTGKLFVFEPLNLEANDLLHPRSMISQNGFLLPGSFIGLPILYGTVGRLLGLGALPYLTAILTSLAALAFYALISKIYSQRVGFISFLLFLIHPAIFYYTSRSFFHNAPFVSLLIITAFFYINKPFTTLHFATPHSKFPTSKNLADRPNSLGRLDLFFGSLMLGLALLLRTSEAVWVVPLTLILLFIASRGRERLKSLVITLSILSLFATSLLSMNYWLYGHPMRIGYTAAPQALVREIESRDAETTFIPESTFNRFLAQTRDFKKYILPFGFHPKVIFESTKNYFFGLFWWLSLPVILGLILTLWQVFYKKLPYSEKIYLAVTIFITIYLFIYYGSFRLQDNPTLGRITITSSYLRYWMPIFVATIPLAAKFLISVADRFKTRIFYNVVLGAELVFVAALGARLALFGLDDGLVFVRENVQSFARTRDRAVEITEPNSIIIVDRADKIFFPARRVAYPLRDDKTFVALPMLAARAPTYYYGLGLNHKEAQSLNERLGKIELKMERVEIFGKEALYKLQIADFKLQIGAPSVIPSAARDLTSSN